MSRRFNFGGSSAIVTGATAGIGQSITRHLVARGTRVLAIGRRQQRLDELVARHSPSVIAIAADLAQPASIDTIDEAVRTHFGGQLNLLVNNAGIGAIGPFEQASAERLRQLFEINFFAATELTRRMHPRLMAADERHVCNIGSVLGHCAVPDKSEYCASKFALHGWNDALRAEWRAQGIGVTLVSPSTTRSEFFDSLVETSPSVRSRSFGSSTPDAVARAAINAIHRRRREVVLSWGGKALVYADRVVPGLVSRLLSR